MSIASHIDLNTLDALSLTCRQIRVNLLQFRTQLLNSTLRCENEDVELDPEHTFRYRARAADWYWVDQGRDTNGAGKVGDCARDMVGGCRKCGRVVCRVSIHFHITHCFTQRETMNQNTFDGSKCEILRYTNLVELHNQSASSRSSSQPS